jgi:tetratricopeptide (TPR) repeat protein
LASAADPLYRTVFVGREAELKQLQSAFDAAMSGQGGLVMVVGEPGIGKTAVCQQLATYVSLRGGRTLVGHCYEEGSLSLPYLAFVEAMRTYVLARDPDGLKSDLGTGAADVARIVSEVTDRVAVELRDAGDPEDDRWRLLQSVTTFLRNAATVQPLVIVLEDLHWADRGTLDLLQQLSRNLQGARLVVVGTYRDVEVDRAHPLSGALAELRRSGTFLRVPLRGLTVDEVHRMYETLRGQEVAWAQAEAVHRQTEGNPLFVQEVLRYLVEEGIVVREGDRYVAQQPGQGVPEGLRDVIGRRLSHLGDRTNTVLSVASVIGRDFRLEVLQQVAGLTEEDLYTALEEAQERAIIEQVQSPAGVAFRFTHAMFRTLLYDEIFAPRRIRLHQQVGRALEEVHARRLEDHAAELAEHFAQSTETADLEKAVHYGELAAQRAMGVFAYGEAVRHLEQALRAQEVLDPEEDPKVCTLLLELGTAQMLAGEPLRAAEETAERAHASSAARGDDHSAFKACYLAVEALLRFGERPYCSSSERGRVQEWLSRAQNHTLPSTTERAWVDALTASYKVNPANPIEAGALRRFALDSAYKSGDLNLIFCGTAQVLGNAAPQAKADQIQTAESALGSLSESVSIANRTETLWHAGEVLLEWARREEAESCWEEAKRLTERSRDAYLLVHAIEYDIISATLDGRLEDAVGICDALAQRGEELGSSAFSRPVSAQLRQMPLIYLGRQDEALAAAVMRPGIHGALQMSAQVEVGETQEAEVTLKKIIGDLQVTPTNFDLPTNLLSWLLRTATVIGDRDAADVLSKCVSPIPHLIHVGAYMRSFARLLGDAHMLLGNPPEARELFKHGLASCSAIRFRPEVALIRLSLAELLLEHYPDERDAAIEHLDFAIAEFREMKMQPSLERALRHRGLLKA